MPIKIDAPGNFADAMLSDLSPQEASKRYHLSPQALWNVAPLLGEKRGGRWYLSPSKIEAWKRKDYARLRALWLAEPAPAIEGRADAY